MASFTITDKSTRRLLVPANTNWHLMSEWLSVARIHDRESYNAVINGMNGYNMKEFNKSISFNT
jgi:hypothetical protein